MTFHVGFRIFTFYMQEAAACSSMYCLQRGEMPRCTKTNHWTEGSRSTAHAYHTGKIPPVRRWERPMLVRLQILNGFMVLGV